MSDNDLASTAGKVSYVAFSEDTNGAYSIMEIVVLPGDGPPPHVHLKEDEGFYVLEGLFHFWVGKNESVARTGGSAFGPRNVVHRFQNVDDKPGRLLLIFTPGGCEQYFMELAKARVEGGDDLLEKEEAIDKKYGMVINRRLPKH